MSVLREKVDVDIEAFAVVHTATETGREWFTWVDVLAVIVTGAPTLIWLYFVCMQFPQCRLTKLNL